MKRTTSTYGITYSYSCNNGYRFSIADVNKKLSSKELKELLLKQVVKYLEENGLDE